MAAEIFKFPYNASRRLYSRRPRKSKNGTPEERARIAAENAAPAASIVALTKPMAPRRDGRTLRSYALRAASAPISPAVSIVGKICAAENAYGGGMPAVHVLADWFADLRKGAKAARKVADELDARAEYLKNVIQAAD